MRLTQFLLVLLILHLPAHLSSAHSHPDDYFGGSTTVSSLSRPNAPPFINNYTINDTIEIDPTTEQNWFNLSVLTPRLLILNTTNSNTLIQVYDQNLKKLHEKPYGEFSFYLGMMNGSYLFFVDGDATLIQFTEIDNAAAFQPSDNFKLTNTSQWTDTTVDWFNVSLDSEGPWLIEIVMTTIYQGYSYRDPTFLDQFFSDTYLYAIHSYNDTAEIYSYYLDSGFSSLYIKFPLILGRELTFQVRSQNITDFFPLYTYFSNEISNQNYTYQYVESSFQREYRQVLQFSFYSVPTKVWALTDWNQLQGFIFDTNAALSSYEIFDFILPLQIEFTNGTISLKTVLTQNGEIISEGSSMEVLSLDHDYAYQQLVSDDGVLQKKQISDIHFQYFKTTTLVGSEELTPVHLYYGDLPDEISWDIRFDSGYQYYGITLSGVESIQVQGTHEVTGHDLLSPISPLEMGHFNISYTGSIPSYYNNDSVKLLVHDLLIPTQLTIGNRSYNFFQYLLEEDHIIAPVDPYSIVSEGIEVNASISGSVYYEESSILNREISYDLETGIASHWIENYQSNYQGWTINVTLSQQVNDPTPTSETTTVRTARYSPSVSSTKTTNFWFTPVFIMLIVLQNRKEKR